MATNVNVTPPRTVPIALIIAGMFLIGLAVYAYSFGERPDSNLTVFLILLGLCILFVSIPVNKWEKEKYYANRPFSRNYFPLVS